MATEEDVRNRLYEPVGRLKVCLRGLMKKSLQIWSAEAIEISNAWEDIKCSGVERREATMDPNTIQALDGEISPSWMLLLQLIGGIID